MVKILNHDQARIEVDQAAHLEKLRARRDELVAIRMKEYNAMLGGLQAIAHADPETPASQLQQIATAMLEYVKRS